MSAVSLRRPGGSSPWTPVSRARELGELRCGVWLAVVLGALGLAGVAEAHGIWGHVHVTGWAVENLPEGELRSFFDDPEVMNAALFGAAFTDSGYWPQGGALATRSRAYSEHTHWEPFIEDFVAWILANDPPPWTSQASRMRAAFLMGCAAHGMQDELFDSLFLDQVALHDNGSQENADPGTDGFLGLDGWLRFRPTPWLPMDTLLELYARLDAGVDADTIQRSVDLMELVYLRHPEGIAAMGVHYAPELAWTHDHYLDPDVPGSLRAEVLPTARYLEALWARLHGDDRAGAPVIYAWPDTPRRLRSGEPGSPDSSVTFVFGAGLRYDDTAPAWTDEATAAPVPFTRRGTRWGNSWPRLIRLQPDAALAPGAWSVASLPAGAALINGATTSADFTHRLQVTCAPGPDCPELASSPAADIGEPAPPVEPDAGGVEDAALDVAAPDPSPDTSPDTTAPDAAPDAPEEDAAAPPAASQGDEGCACTAPSARPATPGLLRVWGLAGALLLAAWWRR